MRPILFLACLFFLAVDSPAADRVGTWSEVVDSGDGQYSLLFDADGKRVDLTKLGGALAPADVRVKIHRRDGRPLDLKLKALDVPDEPVHYVGQFQDWNGSVMGFELEMSFDKKTWKKVERFFGAHAP